MPHFGEGIHWEKDYSYLLYRWGNVYKAKPGRIALPWLRNPLFSTVHQGAVDRMPRGGKISIAEGSFVVDARITLHDDGPLAIVGENPDYAPGGGTVLQLADDVDDHMYFCAPDGNVWWHSFRHLTLDGNKANNVAGSGIYVAPPVNKLNDLWIENVFIANFRQYGAYFDKVWSYRINGLVIELCDAAGMRINTGDFATIINSNFSSNGQEGIWMRSGHTVIVSTWFGGNGLDGLLLYNANNNIVLGGNINNNSQGGVGANSGVALTGTSPNNRFIGVTFNGGAQEAYGINVAATVVGTRIDQCVFSNHTLGDILDAGTQTRINDLGREAAASGVAPVAANWDTGDLVQNATFPTEIWIKDYAGVMRRLA